MLVATFALITVWVLQVSKAIDVTHYTERAGGIVPVQRMRYEWHPERVTPFLKTFPAKVRSAFREKMGRLHKGAAVRKEKPEDGLQTGYQPIRLKNGSEIYGRIVEEKEGVVRVEVEGGTVSFKKDEILTPAP